jgi:hypothetical protein
MVLSAVGCGFSASREAAAESMARYFEAVEHRDYDAALAVCADSFFQETSREVREAELAANARRLGDLLSYEAVSWNVKKNVGAGAGTYVKVVYKTRYSRQPAVERFILKKVDRQFAIIAHQIEARGLPRGKTHFI